MRVILPMLLALAIGAPASAQVRPFRPLPPVDPVRRAGEGYLTRISQESSRTVATDDSTARRQCLAERKTGRVVCHTRAEWERVASRLSEGKGWK